MTLAVYPTELSQRFRVQGFTKSFLDKQIVAQPARGRAWIRHGGKTVGGRPVVANTPPMGIGDLARFWRFYEEELDFGTLPFKIRDQQLDGVPSADEAGNPLTDENGNPLLMGAYWVCLFGQTKPTETPLGGNKWAVSFQLLVLSP